jgi:putative isomerase
MIPDVIRTESGGGVNWCNTKPPLASWATVGVWRANPADKLFAREMLPKLLAYHRWWYAVRDHDKNGRTEFGSSSNNSVCMAWECGMDNAIRFDGTKMVANDAGCFSADQESVDLNAFLYADKLLIAVLADATGNASLATALRQEAVSLRRAMQLAFYSSTSGFMHDRRLEGPLLNGSGCEAFAALWAGIPTQAQANTMAKVLANESKFNTFLPFPTYAADEESFDPAGYWRGPVWIDQAYFATGGLYQNSVQTAS